MAETLMDEQIDLSTVETRELLNMAFGHKNVIRYTAGMMGRWYTDPNATMELWSCKVEDLSLSLHAVVVELCNRVEASHNQLAEDKAAINRLETEVLEAGKREKELEAEVERLNPKHRPCIPTIEFLDHVQGTNCAEWRCKVCGATWVSPTLLPCPKCDSDDDSRPIEGDRGDGDVNGKG